MKRYSFIGAGNMAYAIVCGMGESADITVYDKISSQYGKFAETVKRAKSLDDAVENADVIVFAIKPQNFKDVLKEIRESKIQLDGKLFITIAAGITIASICNGLGGEVPVIRAMPNTPLLIGKGVTAISGNALVSLDDFDEVSRLFSAIGTVLKLDESQMNTVICATSSAPAYVYHFIDCIVKEAVEQGLPREKMLCAVCEMVKGSADMIMNTDKSPEELIRMVTSPNGTTERAMNVIYENKLCDIVSEAMRACTKRAEELSKELE